MVYRALDEDRFLGKFYKANFSYFSMKTYVVTPC